MKATDAPLIFALIALIALPLSCRKEKAPAPPLLLSEISGSVLWRRVAVEEAYDDYPEWPGQEGLKRGQSPHGRYHEIYINRILRQALPIAERKAPEGSIIVKENFDADKKRTNYTVMAKVKGYDPERSDWFWAMYGPDGATLAEGKVGMCVDCHQGMSDNDYIIVHPLDAPPEGGKR